MTRRRLLFITNLLPFPLDGGGKIRSFNLLRVLSALYQVDLLCFVDEEDDKQYVKDVERLGISVSCVVKPIRLRHRRQRLVLQVARSLFSRYPYSVLKFRSSRMRTLVRHKLSGADYDKLYVENLPLFQYVPESLVRRSREKTVLDQQNVESEIVRRTLECETNVWKRILLRLEYHKLVKYERMACLAAGLVLAITDNDRDTIMRITGGGSNCHTAPFFMQKSGSRNDYLNGAHDKVILFVGTMSWFPNEEGVLWFCRNVFDRYHLDEMGWSLLVVGSSPGPSVLKVSNGGSVNVTGYVDDVAPFVRKALVGIVPLRIGGGMRIKIFDLFSFGLPVIATSIGAEGIPVSHGETILIADTEEEYLNCLKLIEDDGELRARLSRNAFEFFRRQCSFEDAVRDYSRLLSGLRSVP